MTDDHTTPTEPRPKFEVLPMDPGAFEVAHKLISTTLGDRVDRLGHGFADSHGMAQDYSFRPPNLGTRKRLGALQGDRKLTSKPGLYFAHWMGTALLNVGGRDLTAMKRGQAALEVARLPLGDFLLLMFAWQHSAHPEGLPVGLPGCVSCGIPFDDVTVDLATLELKVLPDGVTAEDPAVARVGLRKGFEFRGEAVRTVMLRPPTWLDVYWPVSAAQWRNSALLQERVLRGAIYATDANGKVKLPAGALDELWPVDLDLMNEALGQLVPFPIMTVEVPCPVCDQLNSEVLDWQAAPGFWQEAGR